MPSLRSAPAACEADIIGAAGSLYSANVVSFIFDTRRRLPALVLAVTACAACGGGQPTGEVETARPHGAASVSGSGDWFTEVAGQSGLGFLHVNGAQGAFYYPEILGPGVALFDFDNDGDLDAYLVQGASLGKPANAAPSGAQGSGGRLYRNDLDVRPDGSRSLRFTDVTRESGIRATQYGLGVAAGDVDNNGWVDLLLTNFGANQLLRNNGDGTFADVTASSGLLDDARFAVSAAFVDYDRDGWLDLYVANNVNYTIANETQCPNPAGRRDYCPPQIYGGRPDQLYRNRGGGTFTDVTAKALVGGVRPRARCIDRRFQRRRLDRHLRRQRWRGQPAVDQPAGRHTARIRVARRGGGDRRGQGRGEHGRRCRRLRQRRRRGSRSSPS